MDFCFLLVVEPDLIDFLFMPLLEGADASPLAIAKEVVN